MSNWFAKLGLGLKKSSANLTDGISGIFTKKKVDSQTLEGLEDLLITSDMGVKASSKIIGNFAKRRLNKDITDDEIKTELAADIETILKPCEQSLTAHLHKTTVESSFYEMNADVSTERKTGVYKTVHEDLSTGETLKTSVKKRLRVILMVGVNGAGKTTTIGKLAAKFRNTDKISFIAADTFRAAAVEQLEIWGQRNNIRVHKGANGCDAAALCFDGLTEAIKQGDDIVFIDTAGRLQNKTGLMDELKKIVKVIKKVIPDAPHATLLTIDATTGQNALNQVKTFKEMVDVSGLVVTKLDGTAKGGIIIAVAEETGIPIHYIGVGEGIDDLDEFNARDFARNLLNLN